jgi:hypothetical protein
MRVLNTDELGKLADAKDFERLNAPPEPEVDLQLAALEQLTEIVRTMHAEQLATMQSIKSALLAVDDERQLEALSRFATKISEAMAAQSASMNAAIASLKPEHLGAESTDRLAKAVAMLANESNKSSPEKKMQAVLDQFVSKISEMREPVITVNPTPVTVDMPEPARKWKVDVVRSPQGIIDHATLTREN